MNIKLYGSFTLNLIKRYGPSDFNQKGERQREKDKERKTKREREEREKRDSKK